MKNPYLALSTLLLFVSIFTLSCSSQQGNDKAQTGKEYTSAYICPMHCEGSGSESSGKCPVCGMDYVENADHKEPKADTTSNHIQSKKNTSTFCWKP